MKIVQSFWSKPFLKKGEEFALDRKTGGFLAKKYFYFSCALSCLQHKLFYNQVELVTDSYGKKVLFELVGLPYDSVRCDLDELSHYHEDLWALGKLKAYQLQKEAFLHVDNDIFIYDRYPDKLLKSGLIAQNYDYDIPPGVIEAMDEVYSHLKYLPKSMDSYPDKIAMFNAGILGGSDIDFFQSYAQEAFCFVEKNLDSLEKINVGAFNIIFEQYLFYAQTVKSNKKVDCLLENMDKDFIGLADFRKVPTRIKFMHLIGKYKQYELVSKQLESRLMIDYPETYFKIISLIGNNEI